MHWLAFEMGDSKIDVLEGGEQKYFTILLHFSRDIKQDVMIVMCLHIINHRNNNIINITNVISNFWNCTTHVHVPSPKTELSIGHKLTVGNSSRLKIGKCLKQTFVPKKISCLRWCKNESLNLTTKYPMNIHFTTYIIKVFSNRAHFCWHKLS